MPSLRNSTRSAAGTRSHRRRNRMLRKTLQPLRRPGNWGTAGQEARILDATGRPAVYKKGALTTQNAPRERAPKNLIETAPPSAIRQPREWLKRRFTRKSS